MRSAALTFPRGLVFYGPFNASNCIAVPCRRYNVCIDLYCHWKCHTKYDLLGLAHGTQLHSGDGFRKSIYEKSPRNEIVVWSLREISLTIRRFCVFGICYHICKHFSNCNLYSSLLNAPTCLAYAIIHNDRSCENHISRAKPLCVCRFEYVSSWNCVFCRLCRAPRAYSWTCFYVSLSVERSLWKL